jgi:hypothetical protein
LSTAKDAAAQESAFEGSVAVHSASTESSRFAHGVQTRNDLTLLIQGSGLEIGQNPPQRLSGEHVQPNGYQRSGRGVQNLVGFDGAQESVAYKGSGAPYA